MNHPQNPLDAFDPNRRDKGAPRWATYCPRRSPKFKHHAQRGFALNAMKNNTYAGAVLYEFVDGRWTELARFQPHDFRPRRCDVCAVETEDRSRARITTRWSYDFVRSGGEVTDPVTAKFMCPLCYRANL